jgi:hypothetical protein
VTSDTKLSPLVITMTVKKLLEETVCLERTGCIQSESLYIVIYLLALIQRAKDIDSG